MQEIYRYEGEVFVCNYTVETLKNGRFTYVGQITFTEEEYNRVSDEELISKKKVLSSAYYAKRLAKQKFPDVSPIIVTNI